MLNSRLLCAIGSSLVALLVGSSPARAGSPTMIGANISGGEFADNPTYPYPGKLNYNYWYPRAGDIDIAKAIGAELVRVPFRWDRIQHENAGVLDAALWTPDITALDVSIDAMEARGMRVILDMHNYAARTLTIGGTQTSTVIGTSALPISEYARVWGLLADHYKDRASIWGYDLMNEPGPSWKAVADRITLPTLTAAYQAAVNAIRQVDTTHAIILEGLGSNHSSNWVTGGAPLFASGGVVDPANNLIASAHCYTDSDQSGTWSHGVTVTAELVNTGRYADLTSAYNCGVDRVKPFVDWCAANNVPGLVGEYTSPCTTDEANWNIITDRMLGYMKNNGGGLISGTQWSEGGLSATTQQRMAPRADSSKPTSQVTFLPSYLSGIGTNYWTSQFVLYSDAITKTADYTYGYAYPTTTPASVTINTGDTTTFYTGSKSVNLHYALAYAVNGGGGLHIRGPLGVGAVGGVDISNHLAAGHVLSFYAMGTPGADVSITLGSTSDSTDVDSGADTATGNWIALNSIAVLGSSWQRYEIPLSSIVNASLTGAKHIQRIRFTVGPSDGVTRDVNFDSITIGLPSTNTAPSVSVDTSTGASAFATGQSVTLVSTATDPNSGDSIDYVEFYANHAKIGIDDTAPYQWATSFATAGTYDITAIAYDSHGVATQSAVKTLTIASAVEIIVDNTASEFTGTWTSSTTKPNFYGSNYRYKTTGTGTNRMRWRPTVTTAGTYQVYYWLPNGASDRATNAPITVYYNGGSQTYLVNEQPIPGGQWILLGSHPFATGTTGYVELTDSANGSFVIGDAIRFYKP